ncbi:hypothetical protein TRFO_06220 [Tritrichomonas foetus]|uniref:Uncharacterized protein n=1 Tax=Tritrichomonas foetus TaxID=1144522 RepID=A0A1J4K520_9EUKA|nr:hypothetical protein TRFO_06220 [Tritrichomonas foetus]|eukprot:OHT04774.1 hypothetical protein TRFO_06220 [Tritrichomonas foetus]
MIFKRTSKNFFIFRNILYSLYTMTYIFDILLEEGQFSPSLKRIVSPMWLVFQANGLSKSVSTKGVLPQSIVKFNFGSRLILQLPNLDNAYLTISLCTVSGSDPTKVSLIACSKMKLSSFANGQCTKINFPLIDAVNRQQEVALLSIQASMSDLNAVTQIRHTYPGLPQGPAPGPAFGAPNPQNHRMTTQLPPNF